MPVCHGARGLVGQYRFGARSGESVASLGTTKVFLGILLGTLLLKLLTQFPIGLLNILLLFFGIELAMASRDMNLKQESFVMFICSAISPMSSSAALGFRCNITLYALLKLRGMDFVDLFQSLFNRRKSLQTMA
eukprot:Gb_29270 [translate_table: standard]